MPDDRSEGVMMTEAGGRRRVDVDALEPFPGDFWPEPEEAAFDTLKDAIKARGRVDVPVDVVRRGSRLFLVDGRSRVRAIRELRDEGVAVAWQVNEVDLADPKVFHFIVAKATAGRHLSIGERAAYVVERALPEYERRARERQRQGRAPLPGSETTRGGESGRAAVLAARAARLKPTTLKAAKFVKERCDQVPALGPDGADLWGKVKRGEMPVTRAYTIAKPRRGRATPGSSRGRSPDPAEPTFPDRLLTPLRRVQRAADVDTPGEAIGLLLKYVSGPGRAKWLAWLRRR